MKMIHSTLSSIVFVDEIDRFLLCFVLQTNGLVPSSMGLCTARGAIRPMPIKSYQSSTPEHSCASTNLPRFEASDRLVWETSEFNFALQSRLHLLLRSARLSFPSLHEHRPSESNLYQLLLMHCNTQDFPPTKLN